MRWNIPAVEADRRRLVRALLAEMTHAITFAALGGGRCNTRLLAFSRLVSLFVAVATDVRITVNATRLGAVTLTMTLSVAKSTLDDRTAERVFLRGLHGASGLVVALLCLRLV